MPEANRIGMDGEYDRDRGGRLEGSLNEGRRRGEDDVDRHGDQFGGEPWKLLDPFRPSPLMMRLLSSM